MAAHPTVLRRGSRRTGFVYAVLSFVVLAALIPALHPPQPPVPPTAAYAPEAAQNPLNAPNNQAADNGKGGTSGGKNGNPGGASTPTPSPSPSGAGGPADNTKVVPRELDCIVTPGYPPRQVEDTQSPPCIPSFSGSNGGATAPGVTGDTINVGYSEGDPTNELGLYVAWANNRFEMYGRKIKLVGIGCSANGQQNMDAAFLNDATKAKSDGLFATLSYCDEGGQEQEYYDDLAREGIVSVAQRYDLRTESAMAHPGGSNNSAFEWNYFPSFDKTLFDAASLACDQLVGKPAPAYTLAPGKPRKFGIIYSTLQNSKVGASYQGGTDLMNEINGLCPAAGINSQDVRGIKYVVGSTTTGYQPYDQDSAAQAQQAAVQFKLDGVTTVITIAHSEDTVEAMLGAQAAGSYFPEWVLTPDFYNTTFPWEGDPPAQQWAHAFGFDYFNRMEPAQASSWYWPLVEENPTYTANPYIPERYYSNIFVYYQILLLASGIQMAGPDLTPSTFAAGLWKTQFPNPPSPINEGKAGFTNNDHTFVNDLTLYWYSANDQGDWGGQAAANCYVNHGQRYRTVSANGNGTDPPLSTQSNNYSSDYFTGSCDP